MEQRLVAADGTEWTVTASRLRWRPRRRRIGDLDPVGWVLAALSLPLLALEWVAAGAVSLVAPSRTVVARRHTTPSRVLTWTLASPEQARAKAEEVAERLRAGDVEGVDADADHRQVT